MRRVGRSAGAALLALISSAGLLGGCAGGLGSVGGFGGAGEPSLAGGYLSGRFAARHNAVDEAAAAYARATRQAPYDADLLRSAFVYHLLAGDYDAALSFAERSYGAREPSEAPLERMLLAAAALREGAYAEARTLLDDPMEGVYVAAAARVVRVWTVYGELGADAALGELDAMGREAYRGLNVYHRALLLERAGRPFEAQAAFEATIAGVASQASRVSYGHFLERAGFVAEARVYYEEIARGGGVLVRAAELGLARLDGGGAPPAAPSPAEASALALADVAASVYQSRLQTMAAYREETPRLEAPLALARTALFLDPKEPSALYLSGAAYETFGLTERAMKAYGRIDPMSAFYEAARISMAETLSADERGEEAIRSLAKAVKSQPDSHRARLALANLYISEERIEEAEDAFAVAIAEADAAGERVWSYYLSRGAARLDAGDWPRAEEDLKRAVALGPEEPFALNYLGYSWAERGENLDEAFAMLEKALSLRPGDGAIVDSVGWAHYQLGRYEEALAYLERAARLVPDDATVTDHLGDVYWKLGRDLEARYEWRRALDLDPNEKLEAQLREKLEKGLVEPTAGAAPVGDAPAADTPSDDEAAAQ